MTRLSRIILALAMILIGANAFGQITLTNVKPGEQLLVKPDSDTIWVMNDARMRQVIETGRMYKIQKETNAILQQKCDTLQALSNQKDEMIELLKKDRDYYVTELKASREDAITAGTIAKKYRRRAKLATIGIGAGFALGVAAGWFIFK